jgi:hypothetical protein
MQTQRGIFSGFVSVFCAMVLALALASTALGQASDGSVRGQTGTVVPLAKPDLANKAAAELPPLSGRTVQQLLALGLELVANQVCSSDTVVAAHQYILDGAGMQESMWQANTSIRPPGLETLPQFKVANNASSAKDAPTTSSVVTSTKSGANQ